MSKYRVVLEVQPLWINSTVDSARVDFEELKYVGDFYETAQVVSVEEVHEDE